MLCTILQSSSFIPLTASEEMVFERFILQIYPFRCHGNQSNSEVWTKIHIFGRGLLKEHLCKTFVKISAMR